MAVPLSTKMPWHLFFNEFEYDPGSGGRGVQEPLGAVPLGATENFIAALGLLGYLSQKKGSSFLLEG